MSKRKDEKRRARAKEKAKEARRQRGQGPLGNLAGGEGSLECWVHYAPADDRMRNLVAFRRMRNGGSVAAFFLVDFDCIGLKDAFFDLDVVPREVLQKYRDNADRAGARIDKIDPEDARKMVAAAIRWTRQHDFRLPTPTDRCLKILGGELDIEGADTSEFGLEGGRLNYVGLKADLKKRLLKETLAEFLARKDVQYTFMDGFTDADFYEDEEDFDEDEVLPQLNRHLQAMANALSKQVDKWCQGKGVAPQKRVKEASVLHAQALAVAMTQTTPKTNAATFAKARMDALENILDRYSEEMGEDYVTETVDAYRQVTEYLNELGPGKDVPGFDEEYAALAQNDDDQDNADDEDEDGLEDEDDGDEDGDEEQLTVLEAGEEIMKAQQDFGKKMLAKAREWCFANGKFPHDKLQDAVRLWIDAASQGMAEQDEQAAADKGDTALARLMEMESETDRAAIHAAMTQLHEFVASFGSLEKMTEAMDLLADE